MKKNLFGWLAMATMLVGTGCSSDEVVNDYSPENAIQFGTYTGRDAQGRGTIINNVGGDGYAQLSSFGVFAFYRDGGNAVTVPNFMNNQLVSRVGTTTTWTYSPIKYWPNESSDKIDFYAYAPHIADKQWSSNAIGIEVPKEVVNQTDYLVAEPIGNQVKQSETVNFTFTHAMSRVGFKVEAVIEDVNGELNGHKPDTDGAENTGKDTSTTISVQEVKLIGNFYNKAKLNLVGQNWDYSNASFYDNTPVSYTLSTTNFNADVAANVTTTKQTLNNMSSYFMLIPRAFTDEDPVRVYVKYTVTTADTKLENGKIAIENEITSDPFAFTFAQGQAYDLVLHLGLRSVKLSATVTNWDGNVDDVVVNVPLN